MHHWPELVFVLHGPFPKYSDPVQARTRLAKLLESQLLWLHYALQGCRASVLLFRRPSTALGHFC